MKWTTCLLNSACSSRHDHWSSFAILAYLLPEMNTYLLLYCFYLDSVIRSTLKYNNSSTLWKLKFSFKSRYGTICLILLWHNLNKFFVLLCFIICQCGSQKGIGTTDAIGAIPQLLEKHHQVRMHISAYLDLEKAFVLLTSWKWIVLQMCMDHYDSGESIGIIWFTVKFYNFANYKLAIWNCERSAAKFSKWLGALLHTWCPLCLQSVVRSQTQCNGTSWHYQNKPIRCSLLMPCEKCCWYCYFINLDP